MAKVNATTVLNKTFQDLDKFAEEAAKKMGATCKKGCAHCCYLLTSAVFVEGLNIAEELFKRDQWREYLEPLRKAAQEVCVKGLSNGSHFEKKLPCVFLDLKDNHCKIYNYRPSCCRYHFVTSPPEDCAPDPANKTKRTLQVDLMQLQTLVWKLSHDVESATGMNTDLPITAPLPLLVLFCMQLIATGEVKETINKYCEGLPNPKKWILEYADDVIQEEVKHLVNPQHPTAAEWESNRAKTGR